MTDTTHVPPVQPDQEQPRQAVLAGKRTAAVCAAIGTVAGLGLLGVIGAAAPAEPATSRPSPSAPAVDDPVFQGPVFEGRGWDLANERGLRSLNPDQSVRIVFTTAEARKKVAPYLRPAAKQVAEITGAQVTVTNTVAPFDDTGCPKHGRIVVELTYQPLNKPGFSWAGQCHGTHTRAWYSGHIRIDTEWFEKGFYDTEALAERVRVNGVAHELGHAFGLSHPNTDLNGDGEAGDYECPRNADGSLPLMCSPSNGTPGGQPAGRFTAADVVGLRALVTNHAIGGDR